MNQYRDLTYADSDKLNFEEQKREESVLSAEERASREAELLEKLNNGEISQTEYNTLTYTNAEASPGASMPEFEMPRKIEDTYWTDQLTDEDIQTLMLK